MVEPEEDPHVMAAFVRISIAPVGVADIRHAIGAAAIGGVRDPDPFCVIGSGEGKGAAPRRHECLNLPCGIACAGGDPLSFDPPTREGYLPDHRCGRRQEQYRNEYGGPTYARIPSELYHRRLSNLLGDMPLGASWGTSTTPRRHHTSAMTLNGQVLCAAG